MTAENARRQPRLLLPRPRFNEAAADDRGKLGVPGGICVAHTALQ